MGKIFPAYDDTSNQKEPSAMTIKHQPAEPAPVKLCKRCDTIKPRSEFYANKNALDGLQWSCRECHDEAARAYKSTKVCSACGERKPRSEFYKCSNARDGLQARCKPCDKEALRTLNPVRASKLTAQATEAPQPKRGRGRPRKAPDEHKQTKNVTVDADLVGELQRAADILEKRFGFRPTHSQTMRWLIHNTTKAKE